jgi:hypothetical protein
MVKRAQLRTSSMYGMQADSDIQAHLLNDREFRVSV